MLDKKTKVFLILPCWWYILEQDGKSPNASQEIKYHLAIQQHKKKNNFVYETNYFHIMGLVEAFRLLQNQMQKSNYLQKQYHISFGMVLVRLLGSVVLILDLSEW
jgi:hypothetical protein